MAVTRAPRNARRIACGDERLKQRCVAIVRRSERTDSWRIPDEVLATTYTAAPTPPILKRMLKTAESSLDAARYSVPHDGVRRVGRELEDGGAEKFAGRNDNACHISSDQCMTTMKVSRVRTAVGSVLISRSCALVVYVRVPAQRAIMLYR